MQQSFRMVAEQWTMASVEPLQPLFGGAVASVGLAMNQVVQQQQLQWQQQQVSAKFSQREAATECERFGHIPAEVKRSGRTVMEGQNSRVRDVQRLGRSDEAAEAREGHDDQTILGCAAFWRSTFGQKPRRSFEA